MHISFPWYGFLCSSLLGYVWLISLDLCHFLFPSLHSLLTFQSFPFHLRIWRFDVGELASLKTRSLTQIAETSLWSCISDGELLKEIVAWSISFHITWRWRFCQKPSHWIGEDALPSITTNNILWTLLPWIIEIVSHRVYIICICLSSMIIMSDEKKNSLWIFNNNILHLYDVIYFGSEVLWIIMNKWVPQEVLWQQVKLTIPISQFKNQSAWEIQGLVQCMSLSLYEKEITELLNLLLSSAVRSYFTHSVKKGEIKIKM